MSDYGINLKVSSNGGAEIKKLFDQFKNFEYRGNYFNKIINKYLKK